MDIEELIRELQNNYDDFAPIYWTEDLWTLADLFARQFLNNGGDGFGMSRVKEMYALICQHKDLLIDSDMISEKASNNSGYPLWEEYRFDCYYTDNITTFTGEKE